MGDTVQNDLTEPYLLSFGTIIHWFARYETLIESILAAISGADATAIKLLTSDLNTTQKRKTLLRLLRHRAVPLDRIDQIQSYLEVLHTYTQLRDDIAHSIWVEGEPANMVWPAWLKAGPRTAIKPKRDLGGGQKAFVEEEGEKITYTTEGLKEIIGILESNFLAFEKYIGEIGINLPPEKRSLQASPWRPAPLERDAKKRAPHFSRKSRSKYPKSS
ncbi:MAG: hypothetical protein FWD08_00025 [Alphaproteobacteria bacterium]|nr:hypothetical protein [Alphaproteobacteria bacterium]